MYEENKATIRALANTMPFISAYLRNAVADQISCTNRLTGEEPCRDPELNRQLIHQSNYRMMRLLGNLTAAEVMADDTPFRRRNGDLVLWMDEICRKAEALFATKRVTLCWQTDLRYKIVAYHSDKMEILMWSLLSNALKFTPEGGTVTVTLRAVSGRVILTVADNGCGISAEMMPIVFERFLHTERLDGPDHGLGLGLAISRQIALRHGGQLLLDSREGQGTTVTVALPDERLMVDEIGQARFDYLGGFSHAHINLSDALPLKAFSAAYLDH